MIRYCASRALAFVGELFYCAAERLDPASTPRGKAFAEFLTRSYHGRVRDEERRP